MKLSSETKHRLHAQEIAQSLDVRKYDGIVCVSGDGILVEVSKMNHAHNFNVVQSVCLYAVFWFEYILG